MTDSYSHDTSGKVPNHQPTPTNHELAELHSLLLGLEQNTITDPPEENVSSPAPSHQPTPTNNELAELRNLLLGLEQSAVTDASTPDVSSQTPNNQPTSRKNELAELRSLLLGLEQNELDKLYERLNNPKISAEDLSHLLPEAILLHSLREQRLPEVLVSTVEETIQLSVKRDLNNLADAIFPIIGPATRQAITTALDASLQSFNQVVEHSLTPESFKWRLQAAQTGKSFAEVILLNTLVFRVEQVFLIHKKTGLLLQHLVADGVAIQDADLVSAMLTAIQDFVQDSFRVQPGDALNTLQFGELILWIEQGPQAILAGIIRGNAPKELKLVFRDAIEKIHLYQGSLLKSFQGDAAPFVASKPYLEACLQTQYKPKKHKISPISWFLLGAALIALGSWSFLHIRERQRWSAYVDKLSAEPGIVVTTAGKRHGKYFISGLRDPLAADPIKIMKEAKVNPEAAISRWEPYLSFYPDFVAARAKQLLQPPKTVSLKVDRNRILYATGSAPYQWIVQTRKLVQTFPGITKFQEKLVVTDLKQLESSKKRIEKQVLRFEEGRTKLSPKQQQTIQNLVIEIDRLTNLAQILGKKARIEIIGHTDKQGTEKQNTTLSKARADLILSALVSRGIKKTNLSSAGVGTRQPLRQELNEQDRAYNRSVSFKVNLTNLPNKGEP